MPRYILYISISHMHFIESYWSVIYTKFYTTIFKTLLGLQWEINLRFYRGKKVAKQEIGKGFGRKFISGDKCWPTKILNEKSNFQAYIFLLWKQK